MAKYNFEIYHQGIKDCAGRGSVKADSIDSAIEIISAKNPVEDESERRIKLEKNGRLAALYQGRGYWYKSEPVNF